MCGIAGVFNKAPQDKSLIQIMNQTIQHRGPDGDEIWQSKDCKTILGHRRLSIIDLTDGGKQPMHYLDRYTLTFNGEIYNYIELKRDLISKGYAFKSESDTEVLLTLYHDLKEKCLDLLDGMFAFAIYDDFEKKLFCARDRFGEKPFYYHYEPGSRFIFSSEIKALKAVGVDASLNLQMMHDYLAFNILHNPLDPSITFYAHIHKLKAGHYMTIDRDLNLTTTPYWTLKYTEIDDAITYKNAQEKLISLLQTSIERRLRADVPVGSSLSGGLDSSLIVCMIHEMSKNSDQSQHTFSARFPGFIKDESQYQDLVIQATKAKAHFCYPDQKQLFASIDKLLYHQDEPIGTTSIFAQYEVMRLAKETGITVMLDGQGADEVFAGYHIYFKNFFQELYLSDKKTYHTELSQYQRVIGQPFKRDFAFYAGAHLFNSKTAALLKQWKIRYDIPFTRDFTSSYSSSEFSKTIQQRPSLNYNLWRHTTQGSLEDLLRYNDRNSMAHSREVRLPFLFHPLVEFIFTLPPTFKIHSGIPKFILRDTFRNTLPSAIIERKDKIGYATPEESWLASGLFKDKIQNSLDLLIKNKVVDGAKVRPSDKNIWKYWMAGNMFQP